MGKEVAYLSHGGRYDLIGLAFTDGSFIQAKGPRATWGWTRLPGGGATGLTGMLWSLWAPWP